MWILRRLVLLDRMPSVPGPGPGPGPGPRPELNRQRVEGGVGTRALLDLGPGHQRTELRKALARAGAVAVSLAVGWVLRLEAERRGRVMTLMAVTSIKPTHP